MQSFESQGTYADALEFFEAVARWRYGIVNPDVVVAEAVQLLVDGVGSSGVAMVASLGASEADVQIADLIDDAVEELGFNVFKYGDPATDLLAAAAQVRQLQLAGIDVREIAARFHRLFGHHEMDEIEALSRLGDEFDTLIYNSNPTQAQLIERGEEAIGQLAEAAEALYESRRSV